MLGNIIAYNGKTCIQVGARTPENSYESPSTTIANDYFAWRTPEILIYDECHTQSQINQIHTYLANKYNL